jgi:predicted transposase YbfD/YdcC
MKNIQQLIKATTKIPEVRRMTGNYRHKLVDILVVAFCAIICGAQTYDDLEKFGECKHTWLSVFLDLPHGIPSADTFQRIFELIDPQIVAKKLRKILKSDEIIGKVIAFDGKSMRGSKNSEHRAFHVLSAFLTDDQIVIGEEIVDEKSNEITAIPQLLDEINVRGATVTIDAMGCQTEIAGKIVEKGAQYVLAVKRNQGSLHDCVKGFFELIAAKQSTVKHETKSGRSETREYFLETDIKWLTDKPYDLPESFDWKGIAGIGMVKSTVTAKGKTASKTRYFITTLTDIETFAHAVRSHWGIENCLHWHLDVTFGEDSSRIRNDNAAGMWNVLRKIALEYVKKVDPGSRVSLKTRRKRAGWDDSYLEKILLCDSEG